MYISVCIISVILDREKKKRKDNSFNKTNYP